MFLLSLIALVTFIFARPLDFVPGLRGFPFLYVFFALTVIGFAVDVAAGRIRLRSSPQLPWAIFFLVWCLLTVIWWDPSGLTSAATQLLICISLFYFIGHGLQRFVAFQRVALVVAACSLWVAFVCAHMAFQRSECTVVEIEEGAPLAGAIEVDEADGRSCSTDLDCYLNERDAWGIRYRCEHVGLFGLTSLRNRVRYVGVLHDPNESAMAVCLGIPFLIAWTRLRRGWWPKILVAAAILITVIAVIHTQSRGGQLVFLAVFGVYFYKRYGPRGLILLALAALPVLLLGGRSSGEAEESADRRLECQLVGIEMLIEYPLGGVGYGRYLEYHSQTAHNSFILAPGELGLVGTLAWSMVMYIGWRIPIAALNWTQEFEDDPEDSVSGDQIEAWALALIASQVGLAVGIFFLSFNYHFVLWTHLGLVAAFYVMAQRIQPTFRLRVRPWEAAAVLGAHVALVVAIRLYIRYKLGF